MCMNCGKEVYDWTEDGSRVGRPYSCIVGCSTCANLCMGKAINFPDIEIVHKIYKKEHLWAKVKKQLTEEGQLKIKK